MEKRNRLWCGDNLAIMRNELTGGSVDLCYIDPPFHSRRTYQGRAPETSFSDLWEWDSAAAAGFEALQGSKPGRLLAGLKPVVGQGSLLSYLVSLGQRVLEIYRVLKPSGSLFLHCDPTASHYLKILMDTVFTGAGGGFRNEIVWCYSHGGRSRKWFGRKHDVILYYAKSGESHFDADAVRIEMESGKRSFGGRLLTDDDGRKYRLVYGTRNSKGETKYYKYYLDRGKLPEDWWVDINSLQASAAERTGYPTQKPLALLHRLIAATTRPGDTVLDAYCGSGTTLIAAERAQRHWIGIDCAPEAIALTRRRLSAEIGDSEMV